MNIFLAFIAGVFSFLSPCILPLITSFFAFISGISYQDLKELEKNKSISLKLLVCTLIFCLSFSVSFVLIGVFTRTTLSFLSLDIRTTLYFIFGFIIILFGLNLIFEFSKLLLREIKISVRKTSPYFTAFLMGLSFCIGWTPCIGPVLTSILFLSSSSSTKALGIVYLSLYSLGLSLPFIIISLFYSFFIQKINKLKIYLDIIRIFSGFVLVLIGVLISVSKMDFINISIQKFSNYILYLSPHKQSIIKGGFLMISSSISLFFAFLFFSNKKIINIIISILFFVITFLVYNKIIDIIKIISFYLDFQGI